MKRLLLGPIILLTYVKIVKAQSLSTSDYVAITFMVLGAILTTAIIFMIIHHHVRHKEKIASDPRVALLRNNFRESLDKGYTKKQIIDAAIKQGWPVAMIESALKNV